ncbi:MAG TPA: hypothetical protein PKA64_03390 [Myxococcota bacterium]|nr:hypothetical protein [Myxococcota bacterium]
MRAAGYPDLRYLRHASDFPTHSSDDDALERAVQEALKLRKELDRAWKAAGLPGVIP